MLNDRYVNWGRNLKHKFKIVEPKSLNDLKKIFKKEKKFIFRGSGRSFGDQALNKNLIISSKHFNRIISFDTVNGIINIESGALLKDLITHVASKGWFPPICPGTKYVTIGGMISSNVHGKNSFRNQIKYFIKELKILTPNNKVILCSSLRNKKLFKSTIGGFGLTGIILSAKIKLLRIKSDHLHQKILEINNYNQFLKMIKNNFDYNVFWIDNLSPKKFKGLCYFSNHINTKEKIKVRFKDKKMPFFIYLILNICLKSKLLFSIINLLFKKTKIIFSRRTVYFNDFFFPQDKYTDFNKIYSNGMFQFQFLTEKSRLKNLLSEIDDFFYKNNIFSTFIIIKNMKEGKNKNNFYSNGISISMDFAINKNFKNLKLFLVKITKKYNLRINVAKDFISDKSMIKLSNIPIKKSYKSYLDPKKKLSSELSLRLGL